MEVLLGAGHGVAVDWWAFGVLLYEMVAGIPPFTDAGGDDMRTFENILRGRLAFDGHGAAPFSADARFWSERAQMASCISSTSGAMSAPPPPTVNCAAPSSANKGA